MGVRELVGDSKRVPASEKVKNHCLICIAVKHRKSLYQYHKIEVENTLTICNKFI